ncbi:MAG: hypothetical protein U0H95_12590 [Lachnospira sp.]|jgi:hypothetical protein|nr:hypothetical protein [Lachnospira sp.]
MDNIPDNDIPVFKELEMPSALTTTTMSDYLDVPVPTLRAVIQEMEKRGMLSTSKKKANEHRKMTLKDFDLISRVVRLNKENGMKYNMAVECVYEELKTGVIKSNTIEQLHDEMLHNRMTQKEIQVQNEKQLMTVITSMQSIHDQQQQQINMQREVIKTLSDFIQESEKRHQAEQDTIKELVYKVDELSEKLEKKDEKKKKFLGLF